MADEKRKEKANSLYDGERSKKMRAERDAPKEEPKGAKAEVKAEIKEAESKAPDKEPKHQAEGTKPAANPMHGSHRAARIALAMKQEKERLDLHGGQRGEHKVMMDMHEKEMREAHDA